LAADDAIPEHSQRRYRGLTADERRANRRERLIAAAITAYGQHGYRQTTVSTICRIAGLTPRYFYEAFGNSEALLVAAFTTVTDLVMARVAEAGRVGDGDPDTRLVSMLTTYYGLLRDEPDMARVFLLEMSGIGTDVDAVFDRALHAFADLAAATLGAGRSVSGAPSLVRTGAMYGLLHVARDWTARGYVEPVDAVVAAALPLCRMLTGDSAAVRGCR